jgi:hypothetical protein
MWSIDSDLQGPYVVVDKGLHTRPVEISLNDFKRLCLPRMTGFGAVVSSFQNFDLNIFKIGYVYKVVVKKEVVIQSEMA